MSRIPDYRGSLLLTAALALGGPLHAAWQDEIGFTRLAALVGDDLPTAPAGGLTMVEAKLGDDYLPNTASPAFSGKNFTVKSGASAISWHAQHVAVNYFGSTSLLPGAMDVDLYSAGHWRGAGFLREGGGMAAPLVEQRKVQSHSWIGENSTETNCRLDHAIQRDGFICVVGENNGFSTTLPGLLGQGYHTISVGRDDGLHSAGYTTYDGSGRIKPDLVAPSTTPEDATSWTTPMVASTAGLLMAGLQSLPVPPATNADYPRVVKALLLAGASKDTLPSWANTATRPYDEIHGAGELNAWHSYNLLAAGKHGHSDSVPVPPRGWTADPVDTQARHYFFTIPDDAPATPFCAALTWHRTVNTMFWNGTSSLANLRLRLYQATGTTLGSQIAESNSAVDNVELIHQPALAPGDYALRVDKISGSNTSYALAWHSLPAVTVAAGTATAREIDGQPGSFTITRTGDTTLPLQVSLGIGGSATPGSHYNPLPATVVIPAGQSAVALTVTPVADDLAQGDRSVTLAIAADFSYTRDADLTAQVVIEDKPYDAWRFANFTSGQLADPAVSGPLADADGDQLPTLVEYALGLDPHVGDGTPVTISDIGGHLALAVAKNPAATDILWSAECGVLDGWDDAVTVTDDETTFEARDTVLKSAAEKRFLRLKITRP